jgi:lipoate-protein ligase A
MNPPAMHIEYASSEPVIPAGFRRWRLLHHEEEDGAWNMAVDEAIMDAVSMGMALPTLRLYRWDKPTITLGRNQNPEIGINRDFCQQMDIPIIRRITGGRGILHSGDQGITIAVPVMMFSSSSVSKTYRVLLEGFKRAFASLQIPVKQGESARSRSKEANCFLLHSEADILLGSGQKTLGCAQLRTNDAVLQQCSLRHLPDEVDPRSIFPESKGEWDYPLQEVDESTLQKAIARGFSQALSIHWEKNSLTSWELERACVLLPKYR